MVQDRSSGPRSSRRLPFVVGFLVVGYPLSVGPVAWLAAVRGLPFELMVGVDWIYQPLFWVTKHSDFLSQLLAGYLSLFGIRVDL